MEYERPVKAGDVLKLAVTKLGSKGDPMMVHKEFVIFLKDAAIKGWEMNKLMEVKITKVCSKFAFCERV